MSMLRKGNRKISDEELIRYNSVGISFRTIGGICGVHPTTISHRLKNLGIEPSDTRRSFMEDILKTMSDDQINYVMDQLGPHMNINQWVKQLILKEYFGTKIK